MIVAVYSAKGGVGKSTMAVNLAWASAAISRRKTLLWDLDAQGAASFIIGGDAGRRSATDSITQGGDIMKLVRPTPFDRIALLPADESLRSLDRAFHDLGKRKRLAKVAADLDQSFERIVIDCPPGLTETSEQIMRAADLVVVPVIPSPLSQRSLDVIKQYVGGKKGPKVVLAPVYSMVDRRRAIHNGALAENPGWPAIPMASAFERMSDERKPVGEILPFGSPPVQAIADLWKRVEKALTR